MDRLTDLVMWVCGFYAAGPYIVCAKPWWSWRSRRTAKKAAKLLVFQTQDHRREAQRLTQALRDHAPRHG